MNQKQCNYCKTSLNEIFETGFVGCEKCYEMEEVKLLVEKIYGNKKHKK